jgi:hypothetical protein
MLAIDQVFNKLRKTLAIFGVKHSGAHCLPPKKHSAWPRKGHSSETSVTIYQSKYSNIQEDLGSVRTLKVSDSGN